MKHLRSTWLAVWLAALPLAAMAEEPSSDMLMAQAISEQVVTAAKLPAAMGSSDADRSGIKSKRAVTSDSAKLLQDTPGVSLNEAGGVSSLPAVHGMADDRLRVEVDGMDLVSACPNHMNSPLSYIDPSRVESATVFTGIAPVSVSGDSLGGTIQVKSLPPEFAEAGADTLKKGQAGAFYRSNARARGGNLTATLASERWHVTYAASSAEAQNYRAGGAFKAAGPGATGGPWLAANEVGSTAYRAQNHDLGLAWRQDRHLVQLNLGQQRLDFEGFPNQRMDMTANDSAQFNLRYNGSYEWGRLEARAYHQQVRHGMNMGPDRFSYGALGMPMETDAQTSGARMQGNWVASERDIFRLGGEYQQYTLMDWWPPAGGMMGPNTYWNVDFGRRDRLGLFGEWEALWSPQWLTQAGLRSDIVNTDAAPVQGYNAATIWAADAAAFNAKARARSDANWDWAALARYTPDAMRTFEAGVARKSHSPNLYQRYAWSTQPMATLMNNFLGDGNGYVGNLDLKPEVAHTLSVSGDWHDAEEVRWGLKAAGHFTQVQDYIDARRCDTGQCGGAANLTAKTGFVNLQYVNQQAQLYGLDLSGRLLLIEGSESGSVSATGVLAYLRGRNVTTGDSLYNMMPPNARLALVQAAGGWNNTAEVQLVAAKTQVSQVRNEMRTAGYGLLNLRSSYERGPFRLDLAVENALNRHYAQPLGGAYVGQGASMSSASIPWGVVVPGMGRSFNVALSLRFE